MAQKDFKDKIRMKFNFAQLERIIVAMLSNSHNKVFAGNVLRLFNMFKEESYKNDFENEIRVYIIKKIARTIIEKDLTDRDAILAFLDFSGKYEDDAIDVMNKVVNDLIEFELDDSELKMLDKLITQQLKFSVIGDDSSEIADMLMNLENENYEDFDNFINDFEIKLSNLTKNLKSAKESVNDSKQDISLGSDQFVNVLADMIEEDRNPASKIKTAIQYMNEAFNGGYEKGRVYLALGLAGGWKS